MGLERFLCRGNKVIKVGIKKQSMRGEKYISGKTTREKLTRKKKKKKIETEEGAK